MKTPRTILVADDEAAVRDVVCEILKSQGYAVIEAANGRQALDAAEKNDPDLVILDINMPDLDGYNVLLSMASRLGSCSPPVIVFSGSFVGHEYAKHSEALGAVHHLHKPVEGGELLSVVRDALGPPVDRADQGHHERRTATPRLPPVCGDD
ncbi:MAG: response regulator, partial [Armatimonadota bacterium]